MQRKQPASDSDTRGEEEQDLTGEEAERGRGRHERETGGAGVESREKGVERERESVGGSSQRVTATREERRSRIPKSTGRTELRARHGTNDTRSQREQEIRCSTGSAIHSPLFPSFPSPLAAPADIELWRTRRERGRAAEAGAQARGRLVEVQACEGVWLWRGNRYRGERDAGE